MADCARTRVGADRVELQPPGGTEVHRRPFSLAKPKCLPHSVIGLPEEVNRHARSNCDDEGANPRLRQLLGVVGAKVSADDCAHDQDDARSPGDRALEDKSDDGRAVDDAAEHDLQRVHGVNVGHAEGRQHGEVHDPDTSAEVAAVNGDNQLK